ncbi:MAG TPA: hypothetical protein VGP93_07295, partial [Polyangiaceae bacterium]|nr:hypothetical protein [Polyangiaceae bacterium]
MANPNPLHRTHPIVHLPLFLLGLAFLVPLVWLFVTSLQPREQVGKVPPEWLPRQQYIELEGKKVPVTPPEKIGAEKLYVRLLEGSEKGKSVLIDPADYQDGKVKRKVQVADKFEEQLLAAEIKQKVPANFVQVQEWFLSKYTTHEPRIYFVDPSQVKRQIKPLFGNYPEAIRALT